MADLFKNLITHAQGQSGLQFAFANTQEGKGQYYTFTTANEEVVTYNKIKGKDYYVMSLTRPGQQSENLGEYKIENGEITTVRTKEQITEHSAAKKEADLKSLLERSNKSDPQPKNNVEPENFKDDNEGRVSSKIQLEAFNLIRKHGLSATDTVKTDSYKVDGETVIDVFTIGENGQRNTIAFRGNGEYRIYQGKVGEAEYFASVNGQSEITDLAKEAPYAEEMGRSTEAKSKSPRVGDITSPGGTVVNPTPLQTFVMYTELEDKHKAKFAKDPYSVKKFEGYLCPAKVPTCGFGSTGKEYQSKMTVDEAFTAMNKHIDFQRASIRRQIGTDCFDKLKANEQDAIVSLGYNAGELGEGMVTVLHNYTKNPNHQTQEAVTDKMKEYCKARKTKNGPLETLDGLVRRRNLECAVFEGNINKISDDDLRWLGAPVKATRQQFEEYCNDNKRNLRVELNEDMKKSIQQFEEYKQSPNLQPLDNKALMASLPAQEISSGQGRHS